MQRRQIQQECERKDQLTDGKTLMIDSGLWILDVLALDLWGFNKNVLMLKERKSKERLSRRRGFCKILTSENPPPKFATVKDSSTTFMNPENCDCARTRGQHLLQQRHDSSLSGIIMAQGTRPLPRNAEEPWIAPPKTLDSENRFSKMPERCQQDRFWAWPPDRIEPVRLHKRNCVCVDIFSTVNNIPCNFWAFAKVEQI